MSESACDSALMYACVDRYMFVCESKRKYASLNLCMYVYVLVYSCLCARLYMSKCFCKGCQVRCDQESWLVGVETGEDGNVFVFVHVCMREWCRGVVRVLDLTILSVQFLGQRD